MPAPASSPVLLSAPLTTLTSLLHTFQQTLSTPSPQNQIANPPNALSLLHDASSLLHAQTTKLSLLMLNKPFTPSAIATILSSISSSCVPGLMSVWEICDGRRYSETLRNEIRIQLGDVISRLLALVDHIPREEVAIKRFEGKREEILSATGQIWQTCNQMKNIAQMGIVGVALKKVDEYYALVKDAVEEMETWDPDEEESLDGSSDDSSDERGAKKVNGVANGVANGNHEDERKPDLPAVEGLRIQDIRAAKDGVVRVLKLIRMLYPALRKRRISTFPNLDRGSDVGSLSSEDGVSVLDQILQYLKNFSAETDEIAVALYGDDVAEVEKRLGILRGVAESCVGKVKNGWDGKEDEFSVWSGKWVERLRVTAPS
ncbi:MAG: hypothetical protein Q9219_004567 [cf. Caloplaca sp. 3 TL-2023]